MPQSGDLIDLVRRLLEAEGVEVLSVKKRENGTFGVAVCPSARGSSAAESPRSSQDSISELLREFDGLDPSFLTPPVSSSREITEEYKRTHGGEAPTLEYVMGETVRRAKKLVADSLPGTPPPKTLPPPESEIAAAPHTQVSKKLGAKQSDLSDYIDGARLTTRQRECISLRLEYAWSVSDIARHLGIARKTVDEHLATAVKKIDQRRANDKHAKNKAKTGVL